MSKREITKKCIAEIEYANKNNGNKYNTVSQTFPFRTPEHLHLQVSNILCGNLREIIKCKITKCLPSNLCVHQDVKSHTNEMQKKMESCLKCRENLFSMDIMEDEDGEKISMDNLKDIQWIEEKLKEFNPEKKGLGSAIATKLKMIFSNKYSSEDEQKALRKSQG